MPLYEYKCDRCSKIFEVMQKFSDEPLTIHENCGGAVERLISSPAIQFKGSGWYVTDYARKGGSNGSSKQGGKESRPDSSTSKSTESKSPESKASDNKPAASK